ncbi:MAG: RING finger protein [Candidatus Colwellbacteria bacterium]|nr:RING finger protein [Candidatus Colwellbacteria bacterium]
MSKLVEIIFEEDTDDKLARFDRALSNKKIFHNGGWETARLKEIRKSLTDSISAKELKSNLEYCRGLRFRLHDHIASFDGGYMINYRKKCELQLNAVDLLIEILTEISSIGYTKPKIVYEKPEECPICLGDLNIQKLPMSCGHWCHKKCMDDWNTRTDKNTCPVCKETDISFV